MSQRGLLCAAFLNVVTVWFKCLRCYIYVILQSFTWILAQKVWWPLSYTSTAEAHLDWINCIHKVTNTKQNFRYYALWSLWKKVKIMIRCSPGLMWAHSTVSHKSPYLLSCQTTAFWRRLPFLFFQVQLFRVPFHTALHPWTVKLENKQWPKKTERIHVSPLISEDQLDNGVNHATVMALCAYCKHSRSKTAHGGKLNSPLTFLRSQLPCFIDIAAWGTFLKTEW